MALVVLLRGVCGLQVGMTMVLLVVSTPGRGQPVWGRGRGEREPRWTRDGGPLQGSGGPRPSSDVPLSYLQLACV